MPRKKKEEAVVQERKFAAPQINSFDVIIAPIVTEKSMQLQKEQNKVTMKVAKNANKAQVKLAVEQIFDIRVVDVKMINVAAKAKRVGRYEGTVPAYKKAIVTIAPEDNINLYKEENE